MHAAGWLIFLYLNNEENLNLCICRSVNEPVSLYVLYFCWLVACVLRDCMLLAACWWLWRCAAPYFLSCIVECWWFNGLSCTHFLILYSLFGCFGLNRKPKYKNQNWNARFSVFKQIDQVLFVGNRNFCKLNKLNQISSLNWMHSLSRVAMLAGGVNTRATCLFFRRYMQSVYVMLEGGVLGQRPWLRKRKMTTRPSGLPT